LSRRFGRGTEGQGFLEYILLIGLLVIIGVSIWVLTGPGIGNIYRQIAPPDALPSATDASPSATEPVSVEETATRAPAVRPGDVDCGHFTVAGHARIVTSDDTPLLLLGGPSDCSLVVESSAGLADPLVLDPQMKPARLHCVAIEDIPLVAEILTDMERTFFPLNGKRIPLRIEANGEGPALFIAEMEPHHLIVEKQSLLIRGDIFGMGGENQIDSPTLVALQEGGAATLRLTLRPRDDAPVPNLIADRSPLRELQAGFKMEVLGAGCE